VAADPVVCAPEMRQRFLGELMLFYSGIQRNSARVLIDARRQISGNGHAQAAMDRLVALVDDFRSVVASGEIQALGPLLHRSWLLKKKMSRRVSSPRLDRLYAVAREAGATGGKVSGAGGGGCLLLAVPPGRRARVRRALVQRGLREIPVGYEHQGSRLVYVGGDS